MRWSLGSLASAPFCRGRVACVDPGARWLFPAPLIRFLAVRAPGHLEGASRFSLVRCQLPGQQYLDLRSATAVGQRGPRDRQMALRWIAVGARGVDPAERLATGLGFVTGKRIAVARDRDGPGDMLGMDLG